MEKMAKEAEAAAKKLTNERVRWVILSINSIITVIMGTAYLYGQMIERNVFVGLCLLAFGAIGGWVSFSRYWELGIKEKPRR